MLTMPVYKERLKTTAVSVAKLLIGALKTAGEFLVTLYRDFEDTRYEHFLAAYNRV